MGRFTGQRSNKSFLFCIKRGRSKEISIEDFKRIVSGSGMVAFKEGDLILRNGMVYVNMKDEVKRDNFPKNKLVETLEYSISPTSVTIRASVYEIEEIIELTSTPQTNATNLAKIIRLASESNMNVFNSADQSVNNFNDKEQELKFYIAKITDIITKQKSPTKEEHTKPFFDKFASMFSKSKMKVNKLK
jgi:hypothetical protein